MPETYEDMSDDQKPFSPGSQSAVEMLESLMPSDKAQAVPYALIWEIDPNTGKAIHHAEGSGLPSYPLSVVTISPPRFGMSVQQADIDEGRNRFRERAPVSLERISIKSQNPRGVISYRIVELSFTVHRPDVVFENHIEPVAGATDGSVHHDGAPGGGDSWSSLVYPGQCFALEYGWSASPHVKNGILNGTGLAEGSTVIPGREQIRFIVTNYTFQIQPDSQIKFNITGYEMGEFNLRQAFIVKNKKNDRKPSKAVAQKDEVDPYASQESLSDLLKKVQDQVASDTTAKKSSKKGGKVVKFGDLFDKVFGKVIIDAYKDLGFKNVHVYLGRFNARAGKPVDKYSGGNDMSGRPISEFTFPLDNIEAVFKELMRAGDRLTAYNFLLPFVRKIGDQSIWDRKGEKNNTERTVPEITIRSITRALPNGDMEVYFYVFDLNREYTKFSKSDGDKMPPGKKSREEIQKAVVDKNVPFVSFVRGNSYIQNTNFSVIQDEAMKGIFMRRALGKDDITREQKVAKPDVTNKDKKTPAAQQIFSPTITGDITMVGNFVFDVFNLIWLDFGIRQWDGPFNIMEKEDVIERGSFTTTVKVFSAGTDPLNTKSG